VAGIAHAVALTEATNALYGELVATNGRLWQQHGRILTDYPAGLTLMGSDSPEGPWTPIPPEEVGITTIGIGGDGADAVLLAALDGATKVAAFPLDKWNAMQAARPGENHQRFHAGEVVSAADLAMLESAAKLLRLKAPLSPIELHTADTEPLTLPAGEDRSAGAALTANQARVLRAMDRFDASLLLSTATIANETEDQDALPPVPQLADETVRQCVGKLIESGLAYRPQGPRGGARLTTAGRKLAAKIAD
jgi:hypothetical protein